MNAFSIVGKITDMPMLKETSNGLKTCELPIRVQRNFPNSEGVYESDDVIVEVWRGLAETVSASCKIGDMWELMVVFIRVNTRRMTGYI